MIEGMIAHVASGGAGSVAGTEGRGGGGGGNNLQRWQVTQYFPPLAFCFSGISTAFRVSFFFLNQYFYILSLRKSFTL